MHQSFTDGHWQTILAHQLDRHERHPPTFRRKVKDVASQMRTDPGGRRLGPRLRERHRVAGQAHAPNSCRPRSRIRRIRVYLLPMTARWSSSLPPEARWPVLILI